MTLSTLVVYLITVFYQSVSSSFLLPDPLDLGFDDDQHDYDSVASDEDTDSELTTQNNNNTQRSNRAKVQLTSTFADAPAVPVHFDSLSSVW